MKHLYIVLICCLVLSSTVDGRAQLGAELPLEVKSALQNGTRSMLGKPGPNYWQNHSSYTIRAELLPKESMLKGEESVTYFNNSPDTLTRLVVRLYQDVYKQGNARQFPMTAESVNKGIVIEWLKINDKTVDLKNDKLVSHTPTNLILNLESSLLPGDSLLLEVKWEFEVSEKQPIRTGNYGNNLFFVAYWYPQIAVYDDIDGWDVIDYVGVVEFYNDFNDYEVVISTPDDFMVWATGALQNETVIFTKQVLKALEKARKSNEVVSVFTTEDCVNDKVLNKRNNQWEFKVSQIPDFSFAVTNAANWDGSSVIVDEQTGRSVFVDAVYADSSRTFENTALWARNSVEYMSFKWPGFAFPYSHITTFNNGRMGGGMESPMMANNGDASDPASAAATVFHEIAHTYFPFFMGTNERKYAWMDEGWAANLPIGFMNEYFPERNYLERFVGSFENINGKEREMTLMTLSNAIGSYDAYRVHAYVRPALAYYFLQDALGDSLFKVALITYIERWNGKHPIPIDFFNTFSAVINQDLSWFFQPWFYEKAVADQAIKKVTLDNKIVVENTGGLPLPIVINLTYEDGSTELVEETTAVWFAGEKAVVIQANPELRLRKVTLGSELIPDVNRENNSMLLKYN